MTNKHKTSLWTLPLAATAVCMFAASVAYADQCAWITQAQAERAKTIIENHPKVIEYCEPCNEKRPGKPYFAWTVEVEQQEGNYYQVLINGREVDLAYTFVAVSPTKYENLARKVGCPAVGVSASLDVDDDN